MPDKQYGLRTPEETRDAGSIRIWYLVFFLLLALAASAYATQGLAWKLGYAKALGEPLFRWQGHGVHAPWQVFLWYARFGAYPAFAAAFGTVSSQACLLFILPQTAVISVWIFGMRKPRGLADLHGSASWATARDVRASGLLDKEGAVIGSYVDEKESRQYLLMHPGPEHMLCFAPTRSGKGVSVVVNTLLKWPGSVLVLDIKGENYALTSGYRADLGHRVYRFDPRDVTGLADRFNPLEEGIRLGEPSAIPDAQNLAVMIVDTMGEGLKDYWNKAGFSFLAGVILHCVIQGYATQKRCASLYELAQMVSDPSRDFEELLNEMMEVQHQDVLLELFPQDPEAHEGGRMKYFEAVHDFVASAGREVLNKADGERSGVLGTVTAALALYKDPVLAENTSRCDFRVRDLIHGERPVALYLVLPPSDQDRLKPLTRLMTSIVIHRLTESLEKYRHRLLLLMDEFTNLGKLTVFEKALGYMAGYGLTAYLIVQDMAQIENAYGKSNEIMGNCHVRLAFAPNKTETQKMLSDMLGKTTVIQEKTSLSGARAGHLKNASLSVSETARPLLTPDECARLAGMREIKTRSLVDRLLGRPPKVKIIPGDTIVFIAGKAPIYGRQLLYFQVPELLALTRIPTPLAGKIAKRQEEQGVIATHAPESSGDADRQSGFTPAIPGLRYEDFLGA